jgi:hypothetical protein
MEISKARAMQPLASSTKEDEIEVLLIALSTARQAKIGDAELDLYIPTLMPYDLIHLREALKRLSLTPRADGETAFPALATVLEAVRGVIRASKPSEEQASANRLLDYYARVKAEGTTEPDAEMLAKIESLNARFDLKKPKVIDTTPVLTCCPHCSQELPIAPNIRFWEPQQMREYADLVDSNRAIAAANRAASMEALEVQA